MHKGLVTLEYLTYVSLKLNFVSFNDFEQLVIDFFHQIKILRVIIYSYEFYTGDTEYLDADKWEQLISIHMPRLCNFGFRYRHYLKFLNDDRAVYEAKINKFNSAFWMKQKWFFGHQYLHRSGGDIGIFYSTNPYKYRNKNLSITIC